MSNYYAADEPLSCGHTLAMSAQRSAWWTNYPEGTSGTVCFEDALLIEQHGGKTDIIPTNEQLLDWLDYERAGIPTD